MSKSCIILGTEGEGLAADTIADCDDTVCIPMAHGVDSLNVAAASAVAFWELCESRKNGSPSGKADKKHKFDRGILSIRQNNMVAERVIICYNRSCRTQILRGVLS